MRTAFQAMMHGLDEVESFLAGNGKGFKVHLPDEVDAKRIRAGLKMTIPAVPTCLELAWTPSSIGRENGAPPKHRRAHC